MLLYWYAFGYRAGSESTAPHTEARAASGALLLLLLPTAMVEGVLKW